MKKDSKPKTKKGSARSIEKLSHFYCGNCQKWWSIGDAPLARKKWYCPWCGKEVVL